MDLFGEVLPIVPGFYYYPDFISESDEDELLSVIETIPLHPFNFHGYEAKRRVETFGFDYSFENRSLAPGKQIPPAFSGLISHVASRLKTDPASIGELLVTEYPVGAQINWHRDAFPFEAIAGVSLLADCTFRLRPFDKSRQGRKHIRSITVSRRSMYIIRDEARLQWQHSIAPVRYKRYSITLRTIRGRA